ncbi:Suppressor of the cold-sensitive snRNP bioproteinsis mutant brr1-1 [Savitreella phatthalungensis]
MFATSLLLLLINLLHRAKADDIFRQVQTTWALSRISLDQFHGHVERTTYNSDPRSFQYVYRYNRRYLGKDTNIYVIGGGVDCDHDEFVTPEANSIGLRTFRTDCSVRSNFAWKDLGGQEDRRVNLHTDTDGMTTSLAGLIAGRRVGVAREASVISVKVRIGREPASLSTLMAGLNWIVDQVKRSRAQRRDKRHVIFLHARMIAADDALDASVGTLIRVGLHVIAAGFHMGDKCDESSPSRVDNVISVGQTMINDEFWQAGSGTGQCIAVLAPGHEVASIVADEPGKLVLVSGSGAAAALTAGVISTWLTQGSQTRDFSPEELRHVITQMAGKNEINNVPSDTANLMLRNRLNRDWSYQPPDYIGRDDRPVGEDSGPATSSSVHLRPDIQSAPARKDQHPDGGVSIDPATVSEMPGYSGKPRVSSTAHKRPSSVTSPLA